VDAPVWSNDLLYLREMILTIAVTAALTWYCFYISRKADRKRAARIAQGLPPTKRTASGIDPKPKS
jgi:hypothetical protein